MNCQEVQEKISKALGAGKSAAADVLAHKESCPACRAYSDAQQKLFRSLDAGLQAIANAPVPPSLLPSVRSRIENTAPRHAWIYTWLPAGAAVVLLCGCAATAASS
jgi:anti-sigma factor RsiW